MKWSVYLEKCAQEFPWDFLLNEFREDAILIRLLRTMNPDKLRAKIAEAEIQGKSHSACRVLFLAADPGTELRIDREAGELLSVLQKGVGTVEVDIQFRWAARPDELQESILDCAPNIVHFSGHGTSNGEIVLEDNYGQSFAVPAEGLSQLFKSFEGEVRVVLLNACFSAKQAEGIAKHVDCVIGMNDEINDLAARRFAVAFYRAIAFGRSVADAFELGRNELLITGNHPHNLPILITRSGVDPHGIIIASK